MEALVGFLIFGFIGRWIVVSFKIWSLKKKLAVAAQHARSNEEQILSLTQRVHKLEAMGLQVEVAPVVVAAPVVAPVVIVPVVAPPPMPVVVPPAMPRSPFANICQFCGRSVTPGADLCYCGAVLKIVEKPAESRLPPVVAAPHAAEVNTPAAKPPRLPDVVHQPVAAVPVVPRESLRDRLKKKAGDQEWEALVGGNWLNKIGVLLFVVGIALLLGYEFAHVGPAGRVAIGLGVSLTMLIGGVLLERRPLYRIFARGLIGGGWAALYFTTYGLHALPQIRVIENPFLAAVLLLAVAVGMIVHSLKYKSQTVSGLAYFIAFATLALGENTMFAVLALIPLAASMLVVAQRFDWYKMAVFGVVATYATCASRPDIGAPLGSTQALFAAYWLLFEAFDLLRVPKRVAAITVESLILPLNALGFLGLSIVKWHRAAQPHLWEFLAVGAAAYFISAMLRVRLAPASFRECSQTELRMAAGGYEGPITLASALAAASMFLKMPAPWINVGLLIEAELLFLAGLRFGQTYLRMLAGGVFASSLVDLMTLEVPAGGTFRLANRDWSRWSPVMLLTAACFYFNRWRRVVEGAVYSTAAALLITMVLGFDTYSAYLCVSWLLFAAVLFELGYRTEQREFRYQSYVLGALGTVLQLIVGAGADPKWHFRPWVPITVAALLHYAITLRIRFGSRKVEEMVAWMTSAATVAFSMELIWKLVPAEYLGVAWIALGAVVFELGLQRLPGYFRQLSYVASAAGFLNLFYFHVVLAHKGSAWSLGAAALICFATSARLFPAIRAEILEKERGWSRDLNAAAGTLFALSLAWVMLPPPLVALAWAATGMVLLEIGFTFSMARFRLLGNLTGIAVFGRLFLANFTDLGNTWRISHRLLTVVPVLISQYYAWWRYQSSDAERDEKQLARAYLWAPAILAVALVRFELGRSLAVIGWAVLLLAFYRTGLTQRIADLRWQSYPIAILTFWRCWNTNFYIPESLAGIQGRLLTGAIVIASLYGAQLLAPREDTGRERHARTFYSLLASVLLAVLLYYEVSGGVLTMAWGAEGLALLAAGFPLRDRLQRLSGLFLFLVCVMKLFFYDLRQLGTFNRILSFIVLGAILIAVSWIYTRFRDRIQRYL